MNRPALFPTTVVGSLPRPKWVLDLFQSRWDGGIGEREFQQKLDSAVLFAIQLQDMAGIDIITDGEYRRESYVKIFAQRVSGFERDALDGSAILDDVQSQIQRGVVAVGGQLAAALSGCG